MAQKSHMKQCPGCDRFVEPEEEGCPFCAYNFECEGVCKTRISGHWKRLGDALKAFAGMTAVAACGITPAQPVYGAPAPDCPDANSADAPSYCRNVDEDARADTGISEPTEDADSDAEDAEDAEDDGADTQ